MADRSDPGDPAAERADIPIEQWEAIVANIERFAGERGDVSGDEDGEGLSCTVGNARFAVRTDGTVSAGMPLHDLDGASASALRFDHAAGAITVLAEKGGNESGSEGFEYTFRRP